jgi:hypothetical protein
MGTEVTTAPTRSFAGIGLTLLLAMAAHTAINKLPASISDYRARLRAESGEPQAVPTDALTPNPQELSGAD